ncbi:hypothetical protein [Nitrososphaera viennensis]|uniref:Uncharacterized protein n=2 Tax=Nitrososphaera viennensis TaxID=1034015 RepID=A0A060HI55_9ARCH|nr:hypothetical protein [Nitrososphaera viennensis]AIC14965.1 hypothetical protein NVIE_007520 [Nitrososphaera viennensis EN76]UVS69900.1 hypothetical protein NWT39_03715 [Nitrososphaera viennensis]
MHSVVKITGACGRSAPHYAGHFYDFKTGRIFYALSDRDRCITLKLEGATYDEIVVQVDDKEKVAEMVRKAVAS